MLLISSSATGSRLRTVIILGEGLVARARARRSAHVRSPSTLACTSKVPHVGARERASVVAALL